MKNIARFSSVAGFVLLVCGRSLAPAQDKEAPISPLADGSVTIGPIYTPAPELTARAEVPKGVVKSFVINNKESKIYPFNATGQKKAPAETRNVSVYIPSQYKPGTPVPFSVIQDASYLKILPTILDNMINDKRLPVMAAIFIANGGGTRSVEYDTVSGKYAEFIEAEVLPRVEKECNVDSHQGSQWSGGHGRQFGRRVRLHDGLVSSGVVSPRAKLFRDVRQVANECSGAARRLGVS